MIINGKEYSAVKNTKQTISGLTYLELVIVGDYRPKCNEMLIDGIKGYKELMHYCPDSNCTRFIIYIPAERTI